MARAMLNILKMIGVGVVGAAMVSTAVAKQLRKFNFDRQVVLLMGGSRGLALEIARVLADENAIIVLAARDEAELKSAREILNLPPDQLYTFVCDVTKEHMVKDTVAAIEEQCGEVDVLFNIAGLIEAGPMEAQTNKDFEDSMNTHFWGPLYCVNAVLPSMRRRHRGRIVNIASIAGLVSVPHLLPYSASKHALVGYSEGLRTELLKDNIFVTTVCPGLMRTGSPRNADMKGQNKIEYALFSLMDALPFTSIDAANAARQIVKACRNGESSLIISMQAQALKFAHSVTPAYINDLFGMVNSILPSNGGIGTATAKGKDSESAISPSILTKMSDDAAVRNNEFVNG